MYCTSIYTGASLESQNNHNQFRNTVQIGGKEKNNDNARNPHDGSKLRGRPSQTAMQKKRDDTSYVKDLDPG